MKALLQIPFFEFDRLLILNTNIPRFFVVDLDQNVQFIIKELIKFNQGYLDI